MSTEEPPREEEGARAPELPNESASPVVRAEKGLSRYFGTNKAGRAAAMAICSGQRLTQRQKKAFFRLAHSHGIEPDAAVQMVSLSDGCSAGATEIEMLVAEAEAAGVPAKFADGFVAVAAENAGPGAISVILEAQSLLSGHASSVDVDNDELVTVTITRCPTVNWVDELFRGRHRHPW